MKKTVKLLAVLLTVSLLASFITVFASGAVGSSVRATPSVDEINEESLVMKLGSANSLLRGTKTPLFVNASGEAYGAPYQSEAGRIMVPLKPVLDYTGFSYSFSADGNSCTFNVSGRAITLTVGNRVTSGDRVTDISTPPVTKNFGTAKVMYIAIPDVEKLLSGYYVTYDDIGMIWISGYDEFINRDSDESLMHETAKRFVFTDLDYLASLDVFYALVSEKTNNFTHPFIKADQERFNMLSATYNAKEGDADYDEELAWYIETQIEYADSYLVKYANWDSDGNYLGIKQGQWKYNDQGMASWDTTQSTGNHSVAIMPYPESGGYDPAGGRLNVLSDGETCLVAALEPAALAYQITKDEKYLIFAYDWMYALCQWEHWGPGHFLNAANTSRPLATAYDWLYNDLVRVYGQEKVDYIAKRIYDNGVYEAKVTLNGLPPEHVRPNGGDSSKYWNHIGNWNSCCTLAMIIASLTVMEHEEYREDAFFVLSKSLEHFMAKGLTYFSFDGGYLESAGYWGSVRFVHTMNKILLDTTGTSFGIADFPGVAVTDYFGCHLEGSNYDRWNYHDDWNGTQPSFWYYLSSTLYGNPEYAAIRYAQIHSGDKDKAPHRFDLLFYDKSVLENMEEVDLSLDYVMTSIDAVVSRSSWESGALYAGLMGGVNNVAHGQYDSGNWIYENGGVRWFVDLGADDYNLYGGGLKQGYYKYSAEGNNTLAISSDHEKLPHGQTAADGGRLVSNITNEWGTATVIDQQDVYGGLTEYARRGMLFTNNRQTVVIQDEVKTKEAQTLWWFAHYNKNTVLQVSLADDGRTAYMIAAGHNGELQRLRVSLVSDNPSLKFTVMDTYTYVLDTPPVNYSKEHNGIDEGSRQQFSKLAVKAENVTRLDLAVVIELVGDDVDAMSGYDKFIPMSNWTVDDGAEFVPPSNEDVKYTVYYTDGTHEDFATSKLSEGLLSDPTAASPYVKSNVECVECHATVVADVSINLPKNQKLTVNLNGNTLVQKSTVRVGVSAYDLIQTGSLTVNNGVWVSSSGTGIQCRYGTSLSMSGVDFISDKGYIVRDEGANIIFDNCNLSAGAYAVLFVMVSDYADLDEHYLVFHDCDISIGGDLLQYDNTSLGTTYSSRYIRYYQKHGTYIVGNSTLKLGGELVTYPKKLYIPGEHKFVLGDGVKLETNGLVLPESGSFTNPNGTVSEVSYSLEYRTGVSVNKDNTLDKGREMLPFDDTLVNADMYIIAESGDIKYPFEVKKAAPVFTAYLKDGSKIDYYSGELSRALPQNNTDNGVYKIVAFGNTTISAKIELHKAQQLEIDLGGYTLTATSRITMGDSSSTPISCKVVIRNGKYVKNAGEGFCARLGTTLVFYGVVIDSVRGIVWDNGASMIAFNNCTVSSKSYLIYERFAYSMSEDGFKRSVVFNDSNASIGGTLLCYNEMASYNEHIDIYVMGSSCVSVTGIASTGTLNSNIGTGARYVHIEKGALISLSDISSSESDGVLNNLVGYETIDFTADYSIGEYSQYPNCRLVARNGFYTVEMVSSVTGVKTSLTLYSDFTVNFYLPVENNKIKCVTANGISFEINEGAEMFTNTDGKKYYKVAVRNISADKADDDFTIVFSFESFDEVKTFSVVKYFEIIFGNEAHKDVYPLAASAIRYISAANAYASSAGSAALGALVESATYKQNLTEPLYAVRSKCNIGNVGSAVKYVQLELGTSLKYRFTLNPEFSGTITVNGESFVIEEGMFLGRNYVSFSVRACDMYDTEKSIVIGGVSSTGEKINGEYDLRMYLDGVMSTAEHRLTRLLSSLYTYCADAYSYKYGIPVVRPDVGDSPMIDIVVD